MGSEVHFHVFDRTWGLRKGLEWREKSGEGQGTSTHAETCPDLPAALRRSPQQPRPAATGLAHRPTAEGLLWISGSLV